VKHKEVAVFLYHDQRTGNMSTKYFIKNRAF